MFYNKTKLDVTNYWILFYRRKKARCAKMLSRVDDGMGVMNRLQYLTPKTFSKVKKRIKNKRITEFFIVGFSMIFYDTDFAYIRTSNDCLNPFHFVAKSLHFNNFTFLMFSVIIIASVIDKLRII